MPGLADTCGACRREFSFGLPRCSFCHRPVCADCAVRMAGSVFCGKLCSHSFFYGADEEVDSEQVGDREADEDE